MILSPYQERVLACLEQHERAIVVHRERSEIYTITRYWLSAELKRVLYDPIMPTEISPYFLDDSGRRTNVIAPHIAISLISEGYLEYTILPEVADFGYRYGKDIELYTLKSRSFQKPSGLNYELTGLNI